MELIDREALENKRMEMPLNPGYVDVVSWEAIQSAPVIEAALVVHGWWTTKRTMEHDGEPYCSECGVEPYRKNDRELPNYCPNCGARMGGGEGHEAD